MYLCIFFLKVALLPLELHITNYHTIIFSPIVGKTSRTCTQRAMLGRFRRSYIIHIMDYGSPSVHCFAVIIHKIRPVESFQ